MKKAQGLSLNTIIIAALVLIVLVVLIIIFSGRLGKFRAGVEEAEEGSNYCIVSGGICVAANEQCNLPKTRHTGNWKDCKAGERCCY